MADFTIECRDIELLFMSALVDYPIYREEHREELNLKIFRHYKYREIGFETVDMFLDRLNERMCLIMPAYNELYRSLELAYDPMESVDVWTDTEGTADGTANASQQADANDVSSSRAVTDSKGTTTNYEMPQTQMSDSENYATAAVVNESESTSTTGSESSSGSHQASDSTTHQQTAGQTHQHGRTVPGQELVQEFRQAIINVDAEIIAELSDLFMSLWSANIPFSHRGYIR